MIKIGLTGNIASGKSEVEKILSEMNYCVYDLDKITSELYLRNDIKNKLYSEFGTCNKKEISNIVFSDKNKLAKLENIIHPELRKFVESIKNFDIVFVSGALIFEAGFDIYFDKIIFVDANKDIRLKRLMKRNNFNLKEANRRIESQTTNNLHKADYVIINNDSIDMLRKNVIDILNKITN